MGKRPVSDGYVPLAEAIVAGLRKDILGGQLRPGERIRQEAVASEYGASRIPVRQALQQLQTEGLISFTVHVGARVASLQPSELDEIYKIRERLEPLALGESAPHLPRDTLRQLQDLEEEMEKVGTADRMSWIALDRQFHRLSYTGAPLPRLLRMVEELWNSTQQYRLAYIALPETIEAAHAEHQLLLSALDRRDPDIAALISEMHIRRTRLALLARPHLFPQDPPPEPAAASQ